MKNEQLEFIQRINKCYVGNDCVQIMVPYEPNKAISILNSDGMTYHYKPNSYMFINKYVSDDRKSQFPYYQIPNHQSRVGFKKFEYVNQILDFNRVYIEIKDGVIKENYVVKDGDEALLATKYILPNKEPSKYVNRKELLEFLKTANGWMFAFDGSYWKDRPVYTEERILEAHKEYLINKRKEEQRYYTSGGFNGNKLLNDFFEKSLEKLTTNDIPTDITIFDDAILINIDNDSNIKKIKSVKSIVVKFIKPDYYKMEIHDFPITIYSLEHMKKLEKTNEIKTKEPKFPRNLNKSINKEEIKKAKQLVLKRNK